MTRNEFYQKVKAEVKAYLPDEFANAELEITEPKKVAGSYTGLVAKTEKAVSAPVVNLDLLYDDYDSGRSFDEILRAASQVLTIESNNPLNKKAVSIIDNYEEAKSSLYLRVDNYEKVKPQSDLFPCKVVEDLAISYHLMIEDGMNGFYSTPITYELLDSYGIDLETLHTDAMESSQIKMPVKAERMGDMFGDPLASEFPVIVTNENRFFGASAMFYPGVLDKIADKAEESIYIIPSSVNEVIVMPVSEISAEACTAMVQGANRSGILEEKDILADHVYKYDRETKTLSSVC